MNTLDGIQQRTWSCGGLLFLVVLGVLGLLFFQASRDPYNAQDELSEKATPTLNPPFSTSTYYLNPTACTVWTHEVSGTLWDATTDTILPATPITIYAASSDGCAPAPYQTVSDADGQFSFPPLFFEYWRETIRLRVSAKDCEYEYEIAINDTYEEIITSDIYVDCSE